MQRVSSEQVRQMLQHTPILLDVRDPYELKRPPGSLPDAVNIPLASLESRLVELQQFRDNDVVVICHSGTRAEAAAEILVQNGFNSVMVLEGGMAAWA